MKKLLFALTIVSAIGFSCSNKKSQELQSQKLQGIYLVGGFERNSNVSMEDIKRLGLFEFGTVPFNFVGKDSVILDKAMGEKLFGASEFNYQMTGNLLTLTSGDKKIEMNYEGDLKLTFKNPYITRLDLVKEKGYN